MVMPDSPKLKVSPRPAIPKIEFHFQHLRPVSPDEEKEYICSSCQRVIFGKLELVPTGRLVCPACGGRIFTKPRPMLFVKRLKAR